MCRENEAVGPWGKCETVSAVGVPRCSWSRMRSESPEEFEEATRFGRTRLPLFKRIEVGRRRRISLANAERRDEGSREVVTRTRGSTIPES